MAGIDINRLLEDLRPAIAGCLAREILDDWRKAAFISASLEKGAHERVRDVTIGGNNMDFMHRNRHPRLQDQLALPPHSSRRQKPNGPWWINIGRTPSKRESEL